MTRPSTDLLTPNTSGEMLPFENANNAPAKPAKLAKPRDNDADEAPTGEAAE